MIRLAAQPFDLLLDRKATALIVIDMQRDFVEPGGFGESLGNDVSAMKAIVPTVAGLLDAFRCLSMPVIHTRECHQPDLSDCPDSKRHRGNPALRIGDAGPMGRILICGEPGADIVPALKPLPGEVVIDKPGKGAFYATDLHETLQTAGIRQLVVAGVTTEVCVQSTMREANDRGYDCVLVTDATESYFPAFKRAVIDMITAQGAIVGWTCTSRELIEAING